MIISPGEKVLSSLSSLEGNHDWLVVADWLKRELAEQVNTMTANKDEVQVRWAQGACQHLSDFLKYAEGARAILQNKRR